MRLLVLVCFLIVASLLPTSGNAQVYRLPTPSPAVSAAGADWLSSGQPIFYSGNFYYPTGPSTFFDGNVMNRTGTYLGVPLYEDATLEPYSIVWVPIGSNLMRPFERRREGEIAGPVGSKMPTFPIQRDSELLLLSGTTGLQTPPIRGTLAAPEPTPLPEATSASRPEVATALVAEPSAAFTPTGVVDVRALRLPEPPASQASPATAAPPSTGQRAPARPQGTRPAPQPQPRANTNARNRTTAPAPVEPPRDPDGVWIEFNGDKWYAAGRSIPFDSGRFASVGEYKGFPGYRDTRNAGDRIFVTVLPNGPVAPFEKR